MFARHTGIVLGGMMLLGLTAMPSAWGAAATSPPPPTQSARHETGERIPSEDPLIKNFHSLGLIDGRVDIFRCACPVRDLAKKMKSPQASDAVLAEAKARMQHLYDLGIRTVISFQRPGPPPGAGAGAAQTEGGKSDDEQAYAVVLEKTAAEQVGLRFVSHPMANEGPNSFEVMSDQAVLKWVDPISQEVLADARQGGVVFHCSAGHDRAGILAAYIRMKYEHWSVDQAIDEMRRLGHNWVKYSHNGGVSSWHEDHLRAIAGMLAGGNSAP